MLCFNHPQVGLPASREQYIHRVGRTGRAGKSGSGLLLLAAHECDFADRMLAGMSLEKQTLPSVDIASTAAIAAALRATPEETRAKAYQAWLGFHNALCTHLKWTKAELVMRANEHALAALALAAPPPIDKTTVGKMGLRGVPGLNVSDSRDVNFDSHQPPTKKGVQGKARSARW